MPVEQPQRPEPPDGPERPHRPDRSDADGTPAGPPAGPHAFEAPDRDHRADGAGDADRGHNTDGADGADLTVRGSRADWSDPADTTDAADPRESAYALLQRGHDLMRSRHHAQAATVLARAAKLEPRKGSILEALGRAYYNSGQHALAAETFEALLEVDPSAHYGHYALGQSLKQLGRPKEARTHLRLAVALSPHSRLYQSALDRLGPAPERE